MGNDQGILYTRSPPRCPTTLPYLCEVAAGFNFSAEQNMPQQQQQYKVSVANGMTTLWSYDANTGTTQLLKTPLTCFPSSSACASSQQAGGPSSITCPAAAPFLCNTKGGDGPECVTSPPFCSIGHDATTLCWDGSERQKCPVLPRCPSGYPQRCGDGSCVGAYAECSQLSCLLPNATRCADGVCRLSSCPSFDGCGLDRPFHCLDGRCAKTWQRCTTPSPTVPDCPVGQCWCPSNGQCRLNCSLCAGTPLVTLKPVPMKVLLDLNNTVTVAVPGQNSYICNVSIPSGAITSVSGYDAFVYIDAIPDSSLYALLPSVNSSISSSSSDDEEDDYDLSYIRSPVVNITASFEDLESSSVSVTRFNLPIAIRLRIDAVDVEQLRGLCLAYVDEEQNRWECVDRNLTLLTSSEEGTAPEEGGVVQGYTTHFTSYAIIVNYRVPNQQGQTSSSSTTAAADDIRSPETSGISLPVVIAVPIAAVAFAAGAIGLWLYLARVKRLKQSEKEMKDEDLSL
eukprot:TRINITY_DN16_c1_g1_i2.p1 TRINITY_DN16_c1_g1~~TRINITY_DN16_c1_g1_i2.p1  ORF type:complete len:582 (+),score=94.52 TRINITY_DN16_c1_g1_i2:214-1746(+)